MLSLLGGSEFWRLGENFKKTPKLQASLSPSSESKERVLQLPPLSFVLCPLSYSGGAARRDASPHLAVATERGPPARAIREFRSAFSLFLQQHGGDPEHGGLAVWIAVHARTVEVVL